jgi:RHS repeat-associated protein
MEIRNGATLQYTRYYLGDCYEKDVKPDNTTTERLYLGGTAYKAPAVYVRTNGGAWTLYYIQRDHLGSITGLSNTIGALAHEYSYDPWGRLRNPANHVAYLPDQAPELFLGRGFTGHEHLPQFGLINMNARQYDPVLGRFLSPDPYVQAPDFSVQKKFEVLFILQVFLSHIIFCRLYKGVALVETHGVRLYIAGFSVPLGTECW